MSERRLLISSLVFGVLAISLVLRIIALDHMPGINADETWFSTQAMNFLTGREEVLWTVPTGRWSNPFLFGIHVFTHSFLEPSFLATRLAAVLMGLALLAATYLLAKRSLGRRVAIVALVLMAIAPMAIAYGRFAFDSSLNPLACLICMYFGMRGNWLGLLISFIVAVWIHTTNAFIAPAAFLPAFYRLYLERFAGRRNGWVFLGVAVFASALFVQQVATFFAPPGQARGLGTLLHHFFHIKTWSSLTPLFGDFLNGITTYRYFSSPPSESWVISITILFWAFVIAVSYVGLAQLIRKKENLKLSIVTGAFGTFVLFGCGAGPTMLVPDFSRYGLCLLAPTILAFAIVLDASIGQASELVKASLLTGATASLAVFAYLYFVPMFQGSVTSPVYRTAHPEPKAQVYDFLEQKLEEVGGNDRLYVLTEDVWLNWPLKYLSFSDPRLRVEMIEPPSERWGEVLAYAKTKKAIIVGYSNGVFSQRESELNDGTDYSEKVRIADFGGDQFITMWVPR